MRANKYIPLIVLIAALASYLIACNNSSQAISNNISFKNTLSAYPLFEGKMRDLLPATGVVTFHIASTLFTDYAEKQRLLKIPAGSKLVLNGNGLPIFPEGTIIAKTFYYSSTANGSRQIIETRLLLLKDKKWNAATYRWNDAQTDATLLKDGATVPVMFTDHTGKKRQLHYKIPTQQDCGSCHRSGDALSPIGPTASNLHIIVDRDGIRQPQLNYLMHKGILTQANITSIPSMPDYNDASLAVPVRARAYLDINCAHCHQSAGIAGNTSIQLGYSLPFEETGIQFNKQNMLVRMRTLGEYHMPKTGTTIVDEEGLQLVKKYIYSLGAQETSGK